jgi:hypothetical protein
MMIEHNQFDNQAAEERLDKHLLALQHFAPRDGFDERVLARLRQPAPALARFRARARSLVTPGRAWWASGLAAASSTAWLITLANWLASPTVMQTASAWFAGSVVQPAWAGLLTGATVGARAAAWYALAAYGALGNALFAIVAVTMFLPVLSGWGLYFTMKQNRTKGIAAHAAR